MANKTFITCTMFLLACVLIHLGGCNHNTQGQFPVVGGTEPSVKNLEPQATQIMQQALSSNNPQVRASAIEIVAGIPIKQGRIFMPAVQRLLRDEFVPVRFGAAVAVGDTQYAAARRDVEQLREDKDENVRTAAGYAVYKLGSAGGLEIIRRAMTSADQRVRANAAFLSGKAGDKRNLPLLYEAIKDETSDDRVRLNSIEAIARLGDEGIYKKIWAMLISVYADDRVCGIRAMGALGTSQARDDLVRMLKDDLTEVRLVAAEQLGKLGDKTGERVVIDAFTGVNANAQDQEGRARIQTLCAMATGQIQTAQLKKFLPELLKNESEPVRLAAAGAVFQCIAGDNIGQ